jgi:hypothetical protein
MSARRFPRVKESGRLERKLSPICLGIMSKAACFKSSRKDSLARVSRAVVPRIPGHFSKAAQPYHCQYNAAS